MTQWLAGMRITADRLARSQPTPYEAVGTELQAGPLTNVDVTDATVTFETSASGAIAVVAAVFDYDFTAATTGLGSGRLYVDGTPTERFALFQQGPGAAPDRATTAQNYRVALGGAGSHTLKLVVSLPVGMSLQGVYTSLVATVHEVN